MPKKLFLIGAGSGDPELITIKAINALKQCKVVLYDKLVNESLLDYTSPSCEKIYVGKRKNEHSMIQTEINELILSSLKKYGVVARLKGGDPMVFGRAYEEIELAQKNGAKVHVIPGISSYSSMSANYLMPITKRGTSQGFLVITATDFKSKLIENLHEMGKLNITLIIFMGMHLIHDIVELLKKIRPLDFPIGIFQSVGMKDEKAVIGTLGNIIALKEKHKISSPAIIVVGEAVNNSNLSLILSQ